MKRFVCFSLVTVALYANPSGHEVMHGSASIQQMDSKTLHIHVGDKAIIHWKDFSIEKGELTKVFQKSCKSALLNRVKGDNPSHIFGRLESNGQIFLINPHGIVIGKEGQIDTGAFLASTFDILDQDFLSGKEILFAGDSQAAVTNLGTITSTDGDITLIGYHVFNEGTLSAPCGSVHTGASTSILLKPEGKERLFIKPAQGNKEGLGIDHQGTIEAIQVELKAADNLYELAIRSDGVINATGTIEKEGRILLVGGENVVIAGTLTAKNSDETGGTVHVLGEHVSLVADGKITVDGKYGGGTVLFGGDYQGKNPEIPNAITNVTHPQTLVSANALEKGEGGKIIFWSDLSTCNFGKVTAEGGPEGGDGGFVEISGATLRSTGEVSTHAPKGKTGTLLWDPIDMNITAAAGAPVNATALPTPTATTQPGSVGAPDVSAALGGSNVVVSSSAAAGAGTGTLTLETTAVITWASGNQLSLIAPVGAGDVVIRGQINATGAGGSVDITSGSGDVRIEPSTNSAHAFVKTFTGDITVTAAQNINVLGGMGVVGKAAITTGTGNIVVSAGNDVNIQGGNQADSTDPTGLGNYAAIRAEALNALASNAINVSAGNDVNLIGGTAGGGSGQPADWGSYAQIGHWGGGDNIDPTAPTTIDVPINVTAVRDVLLKGGPGDNTGTPADSCYVAIGHGGANNGAGTQTYIGNITVNAGRNVSVVAGSAVSNISYNYGQIGHHGGNISKVVTIGTGTNTAVTTVNAPNGRVYVQGGSGGFTLQYCYGLIGPGGEGWSNDWFADVVVACDDFQVIGGGNNNTTHNSFAHIGFAAANQLGVGSLGFLLWSSSTVSVTATNALTPNNYIVGGGSSGTIGGGSYSSPAAIGYMVNGSPGFAFAQMGNTNVRCGGNLLVTGGTNGFNPAGVTFDFTPSTNLFGFSNFLVDVGGNLTATASATSPVEFANSRFSGGVSYTFNVGGDATFTGGTTNGINAIVNSLGPLTMNIGNDLQMLAPSSGICDFDALGLTDIDAGRDFISRGPTSANTFNVSGNGWTVDTGRNILIDNQSSFTHQSNGPSWVMTAGNDFTLQNGSTLTQLPSGGSPALSLIAGRNMALVNNATITKQSAGELNLVCDNNNPTFPLIGSGGMTIDATTTINNANFLQPLRIYTARRSQNSISGLFNLNGGTFLAGPFLTNTSQETWCAYFPRTEFVQLFMIFYKECELTSVFQDSSAPIVTFEALGYLHPYDEYLGWPLYFDMKDHKEALTIPYFFREPKRLKSNPKSPDVETFNDSEVISVAL
ncbi:MAG: filamentous hemagglutinin N-terminal domain-containing protein [Chlamydiia bacterium]|nr:filamentous hemagglutinin N-terminal domain-containing protein [Chlamydiia bacterium]